LDSVGNNIPSFIHSFIPLGAWLMATKRVRVQEFVEIEFELEGGGSIAYHVGDF